ncbi:hypothetical protein Tco_1412793 [Tanacetum coccineum]
MPHDSPLPRVHKLGSDERRMQHNELIDLVTKLLDRVVALETNLWQTKKVYGTAFIKLIEKVKKLEKTVKTRQAKRKARIVVYDDEFRGGMGMIWSLILEKTVKTRQAKRNARIVVYDDEVQGRHGHDMEPGFEFTTPEEVYTADKGVSTAEPVSTTGASVSTAGASSAKDKGKALMEEAETIQTKTKLQLEEREMYFEVEKARLLAELINERKRYFAAQRAEERRNKPLTQAQ